MFHLLNPESKLRCSLLSLLHSTCAAIPSAKALSGHAHPLSAHAVSAHGHALSSLLLIHMHHLHMYFTPAAHPICNIGYFSSGIVVERTMYRYIPTMKLYIKPLERYCKTLTKAACHSLDKSYIQLGSSPLLTILEQLLNGQHNYFQRELSRRKMYRCKPIFPHLQ
jgi:hypothetical protein